jgi:hypothetical protein
MSHLIPYHPVLHEQIELLQIPFKQESEIK